MGGISSLGERPVEKADEQEVAGTQRAPWCLRMGWRGDGKTRPRGSSGGSASQSHATSRAGVTPGAQRMCAQRGQEDYIKHFYLISLSLLKG